MPPETKLLILPRSQLLGALLRIAMERADLTGGVLYISKTPVERLPEDVPLDRDVLRRITFVYPGDTVEFLGHLASMHRWRKRPATIAVDCLEDFVEFDEDAPMKGALVCAALMDAATACRCDVYASFDKDSYERHRDKCETLVELYFYNCIYVK